MDEIKSIAKAIKIMNYLAENHEGARTSDIASILRVDKSGISRILKTLTHYGYAKKSMTDQRYHLGNQLLQISQLAMRDLTWKDKVKPFLLELVERTGECSHLGVLVKDKVLYLDQETNHMPLKVEHEIGTRSPLHCTALGKVLLAFGNVDIPDMLKRYTPRTITNPIILQEHLQQVKKNKYAMDDEEFDIGIRCVAAPLYNRQGFLIAVIGMSGPVARIDLTDFDTLGKITIEIAEKCGKSL